jgi:predicted enzyme related to lactoylglutathione lyase
MKLTDVVFYTNDIEKSKEFYTKKLGLEIESDRGNYVSFKTNSDVLLSVNAADTTQKVPGNQAASFDIENAEELLEKYKEMGLDIYKEIQELPFGKIFSTLDPDGNKLMFVERN